MFLASSVIFHIMEFFCLLGEWRIGNMNYGTIIAAEMIIQTKGFRQQFSPPFLFTEYLQTLCDFIMFTYHSNVFDWKFSGIYLLYGSLFKTYNAKFEQCCLAVINHRRKSKTIYCTCNKTQVDIGTLWWLYTILSQSHVTPWQIEVSRIKKDWTQSLSQASLHKLHCGLHAA